MFTLFNSSDAFLLLAVKHQGFDDQTMIGLYIFYNLVYALLSFPLGMLADKIGLHKMLVAGLTVFSLVYFMMGFAASLTELLILFGGYAIYAASTEGISKALISNVASNDKTATAIGFYTSFASIMTMLASSLAGLIWYSQGPSMMFIISGSGVALTAIYLLILGKRIKVLPG